MVLVFLEFPEEIWVFLSFSTKRGVNKNLGEFSWI